MTKVIRIISTVALSVAVVFAMSIKQLQQDAKLTLVSATSIVEGGAHDVILRDSSQNAIR